jgi:hypothetical protein
MSKTLAVAVFVVAIAGCLHPGEEVDPPTPTAGPDPRAAAAADRGRLEHEVARLRTEIELRDSLIQAAAMGHADLSHRLEEANEQGTEMAERLRNAASAIERLTTERKTMAEALERAQPHADEPAASGATSSADVTTGSDLP